MFKKKKINLKPKNNNIINYFWLIVIFFVFLLWFFTINFAKEFYFLEKKISFWEQKNDINKKTDIKDNNSDKINILLVWRWWIRNDAPDLTDSIILASIHKVNKTISMFSIPRDLYVEDYKWNTWKINKVYATRKAETWNVSSWISALKYNIELLTNQKIDYYVNIDFNWFVKFVDAIWWVQLTLENNFVDTKFPDDNWGYRTFIIKKGSWTLDWETALNYARSRHSTSDFDRSIRQQQIIISLKNKLYEWWIFSKISKANKLYDIFKKYVITDIWLSDMVTVFNEVKWKDYKIISSSLNDSCFEWDPFCIKGGFLYTPERELYWGASVLLVNSSNLWNINNYKSLEKYLELIFENTKIYKENIVMTVFNSTSTPLLAWNLWFELRKNGLNIPFNKYSITNLKDKDFLKSTIFYTSDISETETIKYLKNNLSWFIFEEKEYIENSLDKESKIEIIIWDNYLDIFNKLEINTD